MKRKLLIRTSQQIPHLKNSSDSGEVISLQRSNNSNGSKVFNRNNGNQMTGIASKTGRK